jgi:hypothetical protein
VKVEGGGIHLQFNEKGHRRKQSCQHLDIGLQAFRVVRKLISTFHVIQSVVCVMEALAN